MNTSMIRVVITGTGQAIGMTGDITDPERAWSEFSRIITEVNAQLEKYPHFREDDFRVQLIADGLIAVEHSMNDDGPAVLDVTAY